MQIDNRREYQYNEDYSYFGGCVLYWMSRDQRVDDNWALLKAKALAESRQASLAVVFCLVSDYPSAQTQHFRFMIDGLRQVEHRLDELKIPFFLLNGDPAEEIARFASQVSAGAVVCDFSPLKFSINWKRGLAKNINIPLIEVDAHNIVPCRLASHKEEYAARTIRPKINSLLPQFLTEFPEAGRQKYQWKGPVSYTDWDRVAASYGSQNSFFKPGVHGADETLLGFTTKRLNGYSTKRNDPAGDSQSELSPYLHFGNLSAQRAVLEVLEAMWAEEDKEAFREEIIIRRELADNFCLYNDNYDNIKCAKDWAAKTLDEHKDDSREYIYGMDEFEKGATHDRLWNSAQMQMVKTGKMHGYMRMYWAKKILEWTPDAATAFDTAIFLNDKYSLDGRDPNGFTGVAWSVCGIHDRAWQERNVFGKIRYMNYNGCKSKFNIEKYIDKVESL